MPQKNLHTNVYSSFICNFPKLKATNMLFSRWMDKQTVVNLYSGIIFSNKKEWTMFLNIGFSIIQV